MASSSTDAFAERPAKLQKVNALRRKLPHLTASALSEVCKVLRDEGVPELTQRKHIAEAAWQPLKENRILLNRLSLLQTDGAELQIPSVDFWALLQAAISDADSNFAQYFWACIDKNPPSPSSAWRLIPYTDEIVPGNPLAVQTKRKIWACYASFVELGSYALQHEESWLCIGLLRSSLMAKAEAGVSQWISKILRDIFMRPANHLEHGCISLQRPGGPPVLFRVVLSMIVQDGGAHKALWSCKGDAGTRMCMLCRNVIAQRCDILHSSGLPVVGSSEIRESNLSLATDQSIHEAMAKLAEKKMLLNAADFSTWQQATGWTYNSCSLLQQEDQRWLVRPISQYCRDSMHTLLVSGVFQTVTWLVLEALQKQFPNLWEIADEYVAKWTLPRNISAKAEGMLGQSRAKACKEAETFKCTASEGLTLSPILACFFRQLARANANVEAVQAIQCFLQLDKLVACCQRARSEGAVSPGQMRKHVSDFLQAVHAAEWQDRMHSKFHWLLHFGSHLEKWGFMVQCYTHERKHRTIKRFAEDIKKTSAYEQGLLREVLGQELYCLARADCFAAMLQLQDPKPASRRKAAALRKIIPELTSAQVIHVAEKVRLPSGERICRGDAVLLEGNGCLECALVWAFVELAGQAYSVVHSISSLLCDDLVGECSCIDSLHLLPCRDFLCACTWRDMAGGRRQIILPASLR
ncbi:unnamed protein product [Symbiodinium sp. CCMP2592]|nr:unnamed protein product [Symbiodinium sp. CCMP2592]